MPPTSYFNSAIKNQQWFVPKLITSSESKNNYRRFPIHQKQIFMLKLPL